MFSFTNAFCLIVIVCFSFQFSFCHVMDCPDIVSRNDWNATQPKEKKPLAQQPAPYVVVHHSATSSCYDSEDCNILVRSIQRYHMVTEGWEDIGYNFLIGGDGSIYEGRSWGIHGAHVIKYNARSIGICLLGNYQNEPPPNIQVKALEDLITCGLDLKKIDSDYKLIGHRQGSATLCPGDYLFKIIQRLGHFTFNPDSK